jgi:hypothetical protein
MKTIKRFSSSLGNQIKELNGKASFSDHQRKEADYQDDRDLISQLLRDTLPGEVLFDSHGLFSAFILRVEDSTIRILLEHFNVEDLNQASSVFITRAAQCREFDPTDITYSTSQIGTIRCSIRMIASHDPTRLFHHLDSIFSSISSSGNNESSSLSSLLSEPFLRRQLRNLSILSAADMQITYLILRDEVFTSTLSNNIKRNATVSSKSAVNVSDAGSNQLHGLYLPMDSNSNTDDDDDKFSNSKKLHPVYANQNGYLIARKQRKIRLSAFQCLEEQEGLTNEPSKIALTNTTSSKKRCNVDFIIYQWLFTNPSLSSTYYSHVTIDPSLIPPTLGWHQSGNLSHGKLPGPKLTAVHIAGDLDNNISRDGDNIPTERYLITGSGLKSEFNTKSNVKKGISYDKLTVLCPHVQAKIQRGGRRTVEPRKVFFDNSKAKKTDDLYNDRVVNRTESIMENGLGLLGSPIIREGNDNDSNLLNVNDYVVTGNSQSDTCIYPNDDTTSKNAHNLISIGDKSVQGSEKVKNLSGLALLERIRHAESFHLGIAINIAERLTRLSTTTNANYLLSEYTIHDSHEVDKEEGLILQAFEEQWSLPQLIKRTVDANDARRQWNISGAGDRKHDSLSSSCKSYSTVNSNDDNCVRENSGHSSKRSSVTTINTSISQGRENREKFDSQQLYSLLDFACMSPIKRVYSQCSYFEVSVLGLDMKIDGRIDISKNIDNVDNGNDSLSNFTRECEKAHYVIRILLRKNILIDSCGAEMKEDIGNVNDSLDTSLSRRVFTIRRDLNFLSNFHVQLSTLLQSYQESIISEFIYLFPPPFDPFLIGSVEERLMNLMVLKGRCSQKKDDIQHAFAYSKSMHSQRSKDLGRESLDSPLYVDGLDIAIKDVEDYLKSVFTLIAMIDENLLFHEHEKQQGLQESLIDIEKWGLTEGKVGGVSVEHHSPKKCDRHIFLYELGCLVATLFNSIESKEVDMATFVSLLTRDRVPCWQPFVSGGLDMHMAFLDRSDKKSTLQTDEYLLKLQRGRCIGCDEPISVRWGFLGSGRNYKLCRYFDGLFCTKWCHSDQRRQIPRQMLQNWDFKLHRVSRQAAQYLDGVWNKPVILLQTIHPLLYERVLEVRLIKKMRMRIINMICYHLRSDKSGASKEWALEVKEAIVTFGIDKSHLFFSDDLYSLSDLSEVQSGMLLTSLERFIDMLRERDRILTLNS